MNHPIPKHLLTALLFTGAAWPLHAGAPPEITRHPVPQTAMAGSHVTLITGTSDVLATSFHWEKDGLPVPGATSNTLVLRHLQPRDAGDYQCIVGNNRAVAGTPPLGESASRSARLDVLTPLREAGQLDQSFGDAIPEGMDARTLLALPDGGCLLAGDSDTGGRRLIKLTADGLPDPNFSQTAPPALIRCLALHGNGYLAGGDFTTYANTPSSRLVRLTALGTVDPAFQPSNLTSNVRALAVQRIDGEDLILAGLSGSPWLRRLRADGRVDARFASAPLTGRVSAIVVQPDGRILLGGRFFTDNLWPYQGIARLRSDGNPDTSGPAAFNPITISPAGAEVLALALQPNGRIVMGGSFNAVGGENRFYLARLLNNGALDSLFRPVANAGPVSSLAVELEGTLLVGGDFSRLDGANFRSLARLTPAGLADPAWTGCGFDNKVNAVVRSGTAIFAAGAFTQPHHGVVKLLANPAPAAPSADPTPAAPLTRSGIEGLPLLLTAPITSDGSTTYTWNRAGFAPVLTTTPELFLPAASTAHAGAWNVQATNNTGELTWGPLMLSLARPSPGSRPAVLLRPPLLPLAIPTFGTVGIDIPAPSLTIAGLRVHLDLQHNDVNDLTIDLIDPEGGRWNVVRSNDTRRGSSFEHTTFDDDAPFSINAGAAPFRGSWQPSHPGGWRNLRRSYAAGMWQLVIEDSDADTSAATLQHAILEFSLPAILPGFTTPLPPPRPAFQWSGPTAFLRTWNPPFGLTLRSEISADLLRWQPATVLSIRQEPDLSQTRLLACPVIPAGYFRSAAR